MFGTTGDQEMTLREKDCRIRGEAWNHTEETDFSLKSIKKPLKFLIMETPGSYLCPGPVSLEGQLGSRKAMYSCLTTVETYSELLQQ